MNHPVAKFMNKNRQVAVVVSAARQPVNGRAIPNPTDAKALAATLAWVKYPADVRVLALGRLPETVLHAYRAQGADVLDKLPEHANEAALVADLAARCADVAVVVLGVEGDASVNPALADGMLAYRLAEAMQRPLVEQVVAVEQTVGALNVEQALAKGARRRLQLRVPVILLMHPNTEAKPRYAAQRGQVSTATGGVAAAQVVLDPVRLPETDYVARQASPQALRAQTQQSGHSRLLSAIASPGSSGGTRILNTGTVQEQAAQILDDLQAHGVWQAQQK